MLQQAHSHYDSHAADTNAPNNMLTHIKSGYGFESVYISDTYTFVIHIRFCSLCILLRCKVLACSTYLLAIMTDHPKPESTFYVHALCITKLSLLAVLIATPEAIWTSVRAIYCNGYNEENQVSEKQYFHVAQAYF